MSSKKGGKGDSKKADKKGPKESSKPVKDTTGTSGFTKIKCRHILCDKHSRTLEALAKIQKGASFADVAREYSDDKARTGGDLGWKLRGELHGEFAEAAFALPVGGMSDAPVKTPFGYHLIYVEAKA